MLCEKCKVREANIKYTEIINGVKTEHNLCSHCAKEMDFGQYTALLDGEFPLGKLLSGLLGLEEDILYIENPPIYKKSHENQKSRSYTHNKYLSAASFQT